VSKRDHAVLLANVRETPLAREPFRNDAISSDRFVSGITFEGAERISMPLPRQAMAPPQLRRRRGEILSMRYREAHRLQQPFVVAGHRDQAVERRRALRDLLIGYWTGQDLVGEEQPPTRLEEARPLYKCSRAVRQVRDCIEASDCVEGTVGKARRLTRIVTIDADPFAQAELRCERLRARDSCRIEFYADDRTAGSAGEAQRGGAPSGGDVEHTRLRRQLQKVVEAVVVCSRNPAALAEVVIVDFGENRVLELPQIGGVSELVEIECPAQFVGHVTHCEIGAPVSHLPAPHRGCQGAGSKRSAPPSFLDRCAALEVPALNGLVFESGPERSWAALGRPEWVNCGRTWKNAYASVLRPIADAPRSFLGNNLAVNETRHLGFSASDLKYRIQARSQGVSPTLPGSICATSPYTECSVSHTSLIHRVPLNGPTKPVQRIASLVSRMGIRICVSRAHDSRRVSGTLIAFRPTLASCLRVAAHTACFCSYHRNFPAVEKAQRQSEKQRQFVLHTCVGNEKGDGANK
jgi:hypothetical protein